MIASTASTTTVLVVLLVLIGLVMIGAAIWLVVATRRDDPALGPLEVMGERRFAKATSDARAAALDEARPPGALPPAPMVPFDDAEPEPEPAVAAEPELVSVEPVVAAAPVVAVELEPVAVAEPEVAGVGADVVALEPDPGPAPAPEPEVDATTEVAGPAGAAITEDDELELAIDERVPAPESS